MNVRGRVNAQRTAILAREGQVAVRIDAAHAHMRAAIMPHVHALTRQLADARSNAGEQPTMVWLLQQHRMSGLLSIIRQQVGTFGTAAQQMVAAGQRTAAHAGAADAGALLADATAAPSLDAGLARTFARVPVEALDALAGRMASTGSYLSTLFDGFGAAAATRAQSILYLALGQGDSPLDIASMLANALNISRNRARTIARTEMMGAYRDASMLRYRANSDVCNGWQWLAAAGACPICVDLDGTQYGLDEDFDGAHPQCRCTSIPLTRSYADILSAAGIDDAGDVSA